MAEGFTVKFHFEDAAIIARLRGIRENVLDRIVPTALNKTMSTVRKVAAQEVAKELTPAVKINQARKSMKIFRATRGKLVAELRAGGKRIPISAYPSLRETATGVSVKIGRKTYNIPHAFLVRGATAVHSSWGTGGQFRGRAFIRTPRGTAAMVGDVDYRAKRVRKTGSDLPISLLFAPGVSVAFVQKAIQSAMEREARARFPVVLKQEINFAASKL